MQPIDRVISFALDSDRLTSDLALRYLEPLAERGEASGDFLLPLASRGGDIARLRLFPTTPLMFDAAAAFLSREDVAGDNASKAWDILLRAPGSILTELRFEQLSKLTPPVDHAAERLGFLLSLRGRSPRELFDELVSECGKADDLSMPGDEMARAMVLRQLLLDRTELRDEMHEQLVSDAHCGMWLEVYLLDLLAHAGDRRALDWALEQFEEIDVDQDEVLIDEVVTTIGLLTTAQDMPCLIDLNERLEREQKGYFIEALGRLRFVEAERLALDIGRKTNDESARTFAARDLCTMLSAIPEARQWVGEVVEHEQFDIEFADLEEEAVAFGRIIGHPFEQAERWLARLANGQRQRERQRRMQERYPDAVSAVRMFETLAEEQDSLESARQTFVRDLPRVGRNEPCPCGSGKKYKKCCLNLAVAAEQRIAGVNVR